MDVAYTEHSHVIGKGGGNIKKVMEVTSCHIHFPDSNRHNATGEKSNQVGGILIPLTAATMTGNWKPIRYMLFIYELPGLHRWASRRRRGSQEEDKSELSMCNLSKLHRIDFYLSQHSIFSLLSDGKINRVIKRMADTKRTGISVNALPVLSLSLFLSHLFIIPPFCVSFSSNPYPSYPRTSSRYPWPLTCQWVLCPRLCQIRVHHLSSR